MKYLAITAYNNNHKYFKIPFQSGRKILDLVNEPFENPKKQGIPYICLNGACRGCTVEVISGSELLEPPSPAEKRALQVGKTTIEKGYRLACLATFKCEKP